MKTTKTLIITALGILGLASACSVETGELSAEDVATGDDAVCSNEEGVNASMAALAAATAKQLRRWEPQTDFFFDTSINRLALTTAGKARCSDGVCKNVQAILDFQKGEAWHQVVFKGGALLDSWILRDRLKSNFTTQLACNGRPDNHAADNCPAEKHDLVFSSATPGTCATDYWFHAYKTGTTTNLQYPAQLKNQLLWVGGTTNPYLAFDTQGDDVKVDPTGGPVEGDPAASGSCAAVCSKFSTTSVVGQCCSCNGVQKKFAVSTFSSNYYLCQ